MTEFEVCEAARKLLPVAGWGDRAARVRVWLLPGRGGPVEGALKGVSPVNAWVKVDGKKVPAAWISRLEVLG